MIPEHIRMGISSVILGRTIIEEAAVYYQTKSVSEARSQVDDGRLVVAGSAAMGRLSGDLNTIELTGAGGCGTSFITFFPDWDLGENSDVGSWELLALPLASVRRLQSGLRTYGLVLRQKDGHGEDVFERVGAWSISGGVQDSLNGVFNSSAWCRRELVVV